MGPAVEEKQEIGKPDKTQSWEDCLPHRYTPDSVYVSFSGNSVMDSVCFMMEQQGRLYQQADIRTIPDNNID